MSFKTTNKPFQNFGGGKKPFGGGRKPFGNGKKPFNKFKRDGRKNQRFFKNPKFVAKIGNSDRGTQIEKEELTFFMDILAAEQQIPAGSWEQKVAMANKVMEHTKDKEIHLSSHQVVSKVLDDLLGYADAEQLERFFEVFEKDLRPVCLGVYSSYVLQKLMETVFVRAVGFFKEEDGNRNPKKPKSIITELKYNTIHDFAGEHRTKCCEFFVRISKFLLNNLEEFVTDMHANHLVKNAVLGLAGIHIPKIIYQNGKPHSNAERFNGIMHLHRLGVYKLNETIFKVPAEWIEILKEFPGKIKMWPKFKQFPYDSRTSALLQVICIALHRADKKTLDEFGEKLVNDTFIDVEVPKTPFKKQTEKDDNEPEHDDAKNGVEEEANGNGVDEEGKSESTEEKEANAELNEEDDEPKEEEEDDAKEEEEDDDDKEKPSVFKSHSAIRLLQTLISVSSPKLFTNIKPLFKDRMISLSNHKHGIFAVHRLINYVADKSQFEEIFDELCPHFENFFQNDKSHLVTSLSATCLRLETKQAALVTTLQNSLHCAASLGEERPKAFFRCLIKLKPFEVLPYDRGTYIGSAGSYIIQDILQFNDPIFLVNSILESPIKDLVEICQLSNGSFIVDKFLSSPKIEEESREKFVKLFEGFYLDLALQKNGCRTVELLVKAATEAHKVVIAKELIGKEAKLKKSPYGRTLYNSLRLETFKLSQEQWKASWKKENEPEEVDNEEAVEEMETETTSSSPKNAKKNKKNKKRPASKIN